MSQLNGEQARHINAFNTLEFYFGENKVVYSKNAPFQKWVDRLISNNKQISLLSTTKGTGGEGATTAKDILKGLIAQNGGSICSYAADYAVVTNNSELYNLVNYSANHILHLRDAAVIGLIGGIVDAITPLLSLPDFVGYPVTAEDIDGLSEKAASFNSILGKNKIIDNSSSVASHQIDALIKDNRTVIIRLDKLVNNFKTDAPGFVEGYFKAKKIEDTGIRHSGIVAVITDKGEAVISDATLTMARNKTVKTVTLSEEGTYEIIKCTAGNWKLTIVAPGYETVTATIRISRGVIQKQSFILQSNAIELPGIHTA